MSLQRSIAKMNAALKSGGKCSFAASSCVDLGLDDELGATQFRSDSLGIFGGGRNLPRLRGHPKFGEKLPGLVFVNVHLRKEGVVGN